MQSSRVPDVDVLREVLSLGLNPNDYKGTSGFTPLMNAVVGGYVQNAALLLDRGADPNSSDAFGHRALWYAATATNTAFITLLLRRKAAVNAVDKRGESALMKATAFCYTWDMAVLLEGGTDPTLASRQAQSKAAESHDPKCKTARELLGRASLDFH